MGKKSYHALLVRRELEKKSQSSRGEDFAWGVVEGVAAVTDGRGLGSRTG